MTRCKALHMMDSRQIAQFILNNFSVECAFCPAFKFCGRKNTSLDDTNCVEAVEEWLEEKFIEE